MGNHNILITNPQGERRHQFSENTSRDECVSWLKEYRPAPIGWSYQIVNLNRKKRKLPEHILVQGFTKEGEFIDQLKANHQSNFGWYTVKMAKRDLRKRGAHYFTRDKVWPNETTEGESQSAAG